MLIVTFVCNQTVIKIMLVQFSFDNYKCFKEETTLNFVASSFSEKCSHATKKGYSVLKVLTVYGANASGKTKLFDAVNFMRSVVCPPKRDGKIPVFDYWQTIYDSFRLNNYSSQNESSFEMVFIIDNIQYRYGFTLNKESIINEWLYQKKSREKSVFILDNLNVTLTGDHINSKILDMVRSANMLSPIVPLISILSTFNDVLCKKIVDWFDSITVISANDLKPFDLFDAEKKEKILPFIKAFDINIEDLAPHEIDIDTIPDKIKNIVNIDASHHIYDGVFAKHKIYDEHYNRVGYTNFVLEKDESFGTFRLVCMARHIIESLKNGSTLFIDEFDGGIHSFVARAILEMFYNASSSAQLVINTHNTSLLSSKDESGKSLLRKDQIYMTNKNRYGESTLMPITEYKNNLRSSIERNYLDGNLTGVPSVDADYLISFVQEDK